MEFDTSLTSKGKKVQSIPILAPPAQILAQKRQQRFDNWLEREVAERNAVEVGMEMDL